MKRVCIPLFYPPDDSTTAGRTYRSRRETMWASYVYRNSLQRGESGQSPDWQWYPCILEQTKTSSSTYELYTPIVGQNERDRAVGVEGGG